MFSIKPHILTYETPTKFPYQAVIDILGSYTQMRITGLRRETYQEAQQELIVMEQAFEIWKRYTLEMLVTFNQALLTNLHLKEQNHE